MNAERGVMAKLTRSEVVARAHAIFDSLGYIWGAWPGTKPTQYCYYDEQQKIGVVGNGPYIATDCSGFTSWCWGLSYKRGSWSWYKDGEFGANWRDRYTSDVLSYETLFPGIQPGDVLWRQGHVALYIGNNETMQATTKKWHATPTGRGCVRTSTDFNFDGFISYDGTFSADFPPGMPPITGNVSDGKPGPLPWFTDVSASDLYIRFYDVQYTRKYENMKRWRRI